MTTISVRSLASRALRSREIARILTNKFHYLDYPPSSRIIKAPLSSKTTGSSSSPPPLTPISPSTSSPTLSSVSSSFFAHSSGRSRRRQRRQKLRKERQNRVLKSSSGTTDNDEDGFSYDDNFEGGRDTRTVRDILFPRPFHDDDADNERPKKKLPKTFSAWRAILLEARRQYRESWNGFFTSPGIFVEDTTTAVDGDTSNSEGSTRTNSREDVMKKTGEQITANVRRNARFLKGASEKIRKETGIETVEDLKNMAADTMRLLSECVKQFMAGYRKGRDDEVDKMLTEYFQELEKDAKKPRRRRRKRRVLTD